MYCPKIYFTWSWLVFFTWVPQHRLASTPGIVTRRTLAWWWWWFSITGEMMQRSIDRVDTDFHLSCMICRESPCMTFLQSRIPNLNMWRNRSICVKHYLPPAKRQSQKEPPESPSSYQRSRKEKLYSKANLYNGHNLLALIHHQHHNYHHNHIIVATAKSSPPGCIYPPHWPGSLGLEVCRVQYMRHPPSFHR